MNHKQTTIDTYNQKAAELAEYFNGVGSRKSDIERAFEIVGKPNPRVVEVGCGNGRDAQEILLLTNNYIGTDISTAMIELAKANNPKAEFVVADQEVYEVPPETDVIFAFASLLHSDKKQVGEFFQRSHGSLADNGVIYISLKYDDYRKELKQDQFGKRMFYFYTPNDIKALLNDLYAPVYEDTQQIGSTKWFTMALQKI